MVLLFATGSFISFLYGVAAGLALARAFIPPRILDTEEEPPAPETRSNVVPFRPIPRRSTF